MFAIMKEALTLSAMHGITDHAVIHVYLHCTGLDTDFIFNPVGDDSKRLKHFIYHDTRALHAVLDKFSEIIQSGKPVVLDHKTTITVVGYEPPEGQMDLQYVGSGGYRTDKTADYAKANELEELIDRSKGIIRIQNTDHSCMARAIAVGYVYQTEGKLSNKAKDIRKPENGKRALQRNESMKLCQKANVPWNTRCQYQFI
jgi:Fe-S cluster biogenesis protein NfuA